MAFSLGDINVAKMRQTENLRLHLNDFIGYAEQIETSVSSILSSLPYYSVLDYGAVGDGVTDDTTAIQDCIDDASSNGGGIIVFPRGTYLSSRIVLPSFVLLDGSCAYVTELKQKGSSNQSFIISEGFSTFTGTGAYYPNNTDVPIWFGLKDIRVNGNKANQTAGDGVSFYGTGQMLLGIIIVYDCYQDNIYTESSSQYPSFTSGGVSLWEGQEEGFFQTVISRNAGRHCWLNRGPHNYVLDKYLGLLGNNSTGWGFRSEVSANYGGQSDLIGYMHTYTSGFNTSNRKGIYLGASSRIGLLMMDSTSLEIAARCNISNIDATGIGKGTAFDGITFSSGSSLTTIGNVYAATTSETQSNFSCVVVNTTNVTIGTLAAYNNSSGTNITGVDVASGTTTINSFNINNFNGTGHVGLTVSSGFNNLKGLIQSCTTCFNYTVSGGNNNTIQATIFTSSGQTALAGNKAGQSDRFDVRLAGATVGGTERSVTTSAADSNQVDMTSTSVQTITIAHGCPYTPDAREVSITFSGTQTDHVWDFFPQFVSADSTNITIKCKLGTASASGTGDVIARIKIGH